MPRPAPAELGTGELTEADRGKERAGVRIVLAHRVLARQPGVVQETLYLRQSQPLGRPPEQPRPDTLAAMLLGDAQVANIGPPAVPLQPFALFEYLDLDVANHVIPEQGRQPGSVHPYRPACRQPGHGRPRGAEQLLDLGHVDDLGVPGVGEARPLVHRADVRPLLGHSVYTAHGQLSVCLLAGDAPVLQLADAGRHQRVRCLRSVRPAGVPSRSLWPEQEPFDRADATSCLPGALVGEVPEQMSGGSDPVPLLGDQRYPLAHPWIGDEFTWLPLQRAEDGAN